MHSVEHQPASRQSNRAGVHRAVVRGLSRFIQGAQRSGLPMRGPVMLKLLDATQTAAEIAAQEDDDAA